MQVEDLAAVDLVPALLPQLVVMQVVDLVEVIKIIIISIIIKIICLSGFDMSGSGSSSSLTSGEASSYHHGYFVNSCGACFIVNHILSILSNTISINIFCILLKMITYQSRKNKTNAYTCTSRL